MLVTSSAMSRAGSRASCRGKREALQSPPDRLPVSRSADASRTEPSLNNRRHQISVPWQRPPHHVVGRPGCPAPGFRVPAGRRRTPELAQTDCPGALPRCPMAVPGRPESTSTWSSLSRSLTVTATCSPAPKVQATSRSASWPGIGVAEANLVEPHWNRPHRDLLVDTAVPGIQLAHIGQTAHPPPAAATAPTSRSATRS